jgi:probable phosphoglycerate mutase
MKIFLIRHGETTGDIEDRYGGGYDDFLTENGRQQIAETAQKLADKNIEIIFSSDLLRAQQAAEIIGTKIDCLIQVVHGLRERGYGVLEGLTKKEALEKYPDAVVKHADPANTDPDGERQEDFIARVLGAFEELREQKYEVVAVVTHGGPIKVILKHLEMEIPERIADGEIFEINI